MTDYDPELEAMAGTPNPQVWTCCGCGEKFSSLHVLQDHANVHDHHAYGVTFGARHG